MTFREGDLIWIKFLDHSMNHGELIDVDLVGFYEKESVESITISCWRSNNAEFENESFTIGWGMIKHCYVVKF